MKPLVAMVGWRGMVGSVLMKRMHQERDFDFIRAKFFSTSNVGGRAPVGELPLADASDLEALSACDIVLTCQGGDYTQATYAALRARGWNGYWIDAASSLRMQDDAIVILDPLNRVLIDQGVKQGIKNYIGGNCTVSLMMLALNGLFREDLIEWITAMTYQAASGAGAQNMRELIAQMGAIHHDASALLADEQSSILDIDDRVAGSLRSPSLPTANFSVPLAGSLIPWIDKDLGNGMSKEEWKGDAECNKILGRPVSGPGRIPVESLCVRIGAMRCHSQALTIKLKDDLPLPEIERLIAAGNEWVRLVPNEREASINYLSPAKVTGGLEIAIGRLRKLSIGEGYLSAFTVGDQLLWGAAEPLRRMLRILLPHLH
jgi:aspartate-semialdehyde dehydrogenase